MQFRVYGRDVISKAARAPLVVETDSEESARALALEQGMQVEGVEPVRPGSPPQPLPDPRPAAEAVTSKEQLQALGSLASRFRRAVEPFGFRLLVVGCLAALLAFAIRINSRLDELRPPRPGQESRWEYKVVDAPDTPQSLANAINQESQQAWEVVGVANNVETVFDRVRTRTMLILRRRL